MPRALATDSFRPLVSIVVEWENTLHSEQDRSIAMLRELRRQTAQLAPRFRQRSSQVGDEPVFELLVVHDETAFNNDDLSSFFTRYVGAPDDALQWRLLPTLDSGYYKNKDLGARAAASDIVVFLDSDVIPEPEWLERLLSGLDDPAVQIVAGLTYVDPSDLVGKAFALTWFFPLRSSNGSLRTVDSLFANNLAVRRSFYEQHPFPNLSGTSRGGCLVLASRLAEANIPMHQISSARVSHPSPNGFRHISLRALAQGRDRLLRERLFGTRWSASWVASCVRLARHLAGAAGKICIRFYRVRLNPLLIPAAIAIAWYYYLLYWAAETLLHLGLKAVYRVRV